MLRFAGRPVRLAILVAALLYPASPANAGPASDVIAKLNAATNKALKSAAMQSTLNKLGATDLGGTPQELADYIKSETAKWGPIVQNLHLKAD